MYNPQALRQYQNVDLEGRVAGSSAHGLVAMLLDGVQRNLALAKGAIARGDVGARGAAISKSIRILDSLRASLDFDRGGDLAGNLSALYSYMERRLLKANVEADASLLDEVHALVAQVKSAWEAIPQDLRGN